MAQSTKCGHILWEHMLPDMKLPHVLPGFSNSLVSVGMLCDTGHYCLFTYKMVIAYNKHTKQIKLRGCREHKPGGMWRFPLMNLLEEKENFKKIQHFSKLQISNNFYDLPSIEATIRNLHPTAGFSVKSMWLKHIKEFSSWPGVTYKYLQKYCPQAEKLLRGI